MLHVLPTHWQHSAVGFSGSKAAANPKRKNSSASNKAKKQKRDDQKASHANINDWSSDDSSDAEPAPIQDQRTAMSDDNEANADQAAVADKHEVAATGKQKKQQQGKQQSAGRKRKKKSKGIKTDGKRKSWESAKKHAHAKHARASDWTSDDSSDAQPERIIDNLEPMSESDVDSQAGNKSGAAKQMVASCSGRQGKKPVAKKKNLVPPNSSSSPAEGDPHRERAAEEEEDWGQPAAKSGDQAHPTQQAKRKGRLRKARASPGPTVHAAAGSEADLMVDLEDDVPGLELEAERHSISREAAAKLSEEDLSQDGLASEEAGHKTKRNGKSMGAGGRDKEEEAARHAGKSEDK